MNPWPNRAITVQRAEISYALTSSAETLVSEANSKFPLGLAEREVQWFVSCRASIGWLA